MGLVISSQRDTC